ncbi:hypothetical protein CBP36_10690 [Acidovorax carolinensis]|uniref:Type I restriction modification DNA specificity domain-containing protein n=1 Tax=Acidovorax carolinensis TaxID=553814 RepID=A0A240UCM7_9BURK|nr:restriction endonuclease subunit S [Acidovorax carolinensis]ART55015.1 hypothetical protein CBP35_08240 [Acidovorax carolinensis]ART59247.1 hypothetical protein CBP36_10690 [Acidovorax carolinensis]
MSEVLEQTAASWPEVVVSDVSELIRGVTYSKEQATDKPQDGYTPVLRATNIQESRLVLESDLVFVPDSNVSANQRLRAGDIVVATSSGSKHLVGKSGLVHSDWRGSFGAFCAAIRPKANIESRYLAAFLQSPSYWKQVGKKALGVNINNLRRGDIESLTLPLPPLTKQREIVAELEKQFSRLNEAVANLQRVKANLKRYKASVLKAAVEGRLVETEATLSWKKQKKFESATELLQRAIQGRRFKKFSAPEQGFAALPDGWVWASVEQLAANDANSIGAGPFGTIFKAKDFRPEGVPIIFLRHVAPLKYLTRKPGFMDVGKWEELFRPYSVFGGELLITKLGEPPGVCAQYPVGIGPAMVTPDVIKLSVNDEVVNSEYLMYYFNSDPAKRFATGAAFGTTRTRLTLPLFREMPVPLPPLAEQARIVAEVDRHLSIIREVEAEVEANLQRAQALRQATLAKAFAPPELIQDTTQQRWQL